MAMYLYYRLAFEALMYGGGFVDKRPSNFGA